MKFRQKGFPFPAFSTMSLRLLNGAAARPDALGLISGCLIHVA
jgi:hypothetical protein